MNKIELKNAITGKLRQAGIDRVKIENFRKRLRIYLKKIDEYHTEEGEEPYQRDFFLKTFYSRYDICKPNDNRTDWAIRRSENSDSPIAVIIENKTKSNQDEMVEINNLDHKAMRELIYYYLIERIEKNNTDVRHLIVTDMYQYFVFDADNIDHYFYKNHELRRKFKEFRNEIKSSSDKSRKKKTIEFYEIESPYIKAVQEEIPFVYVDLNNPRFRVAANSDDETGLNRLKPLYKLFSDTYMMKKPLPDRNALNADFYAELLYILGLKEIKEGNNKVIARLDDGRTNMASLMDMTEKIVRDKLPLREDDYYDRYGKSPKERVYEISLEICICWINRLLFLKLLESQLVRYHNGDKQYKILDWTKINSFQSLNSLFFDILAVDYDKRVRKEIPENLWNVPYLNSSLFERTKEENELCEISMLPNDKELPIMGKSTFHKSSSPLRKAKSLPTLQYLLYFLDSFDFSSQGEGEIQDESRPLINASVLGKIFEKINGHKDGAIFTPAFVTMSMAHNAVRQAIIRKFNAECHLKCDDWEELLFEIGKKYGYKDLGYLNDVFNGIRIADISVGSGHFLVSALNELILAKYDLNILMMPNGRAVSKSRCQFTIEDDELLILNEDGDYFHYNPLMDESQMLQMTLFNEKRTLIENCLFGVDLNPNSVNICRLRLWIELLKNAYYTEESNREHLATLPNIDINIKQGDSLLSKFDVHESMKNEGKEIWDTFGKYKELVEEYKRTSDKAYRIKIDKSIKKIKSNFNTTLLTKSSLYKDMVKKGKAYKKFINQFQFADYEPTKEYLRKEQRAKNAYEKAKAKFDELQGGKYTNAFEWRFEFPEVLDNEGNYVGFDLIIGNPPYIQMQRNDGYLGDLYYMLDYATYSRKGDICGLFYERGLRLLRKGGILCYISTNKWLRADYGIDLRKYLVENANPEACFDFGGYQVFDGVNIDTAILYIGNEPNKKVLFGVRAKKDFTDNTIIDEYFKANAAHFDFKSGEPWVFIPDETKSIKDFVESQGTSLAEWDIKINYGIKTGYNPAFFVDEKERQGILDACATDEERQRTAGIIRSMLRGRNIRTYGIDWQGLYMIGTFPALKINIDELPALKNYLLRFPMEKLEQTGKTYNIDGKEIKARKKTKGKWFETQDAIKYYKDFDKPKIVYPNMTKFLPFYYDTNKFLLNDKSFFITGNHLYYLTAFFNSSLFKFCFRDSFVDLGEDSRELREVFMRRIPVKEVDDKTDLDFKPLVENIQKEYSVEKAKAIDERIFDVYGLSVEDRDAIGFIDFHNK